MLYSSLCMSEGLNFATNPDYLELIKYRHEAFQPNANQHKSVCILL